MVVDAPATERFACFGGDCAVSIEGIGHRGSAAQAAAWARSQLESWHHRFTRFSARSELSQLNADARRTVPASPLMIELAAAVRMAGAVTDGLVDGTMLAALQAAGYDRDLPHAAPGSRAEAPSAAPVPAGASARRDWATISVDRAAGTVTRPPGVQLDSGGLVKGLLADVLCAWLGEYDDVVVDCCGDLRLGGAVPGVRDLEVAHPWGGTATTLEVEDGAVATSGTTGRRWRRPDGGPGHHLIDPATGQPASTGLLQVTALAPSALEAEVLAKWALLSGPDGAPHRLPHGGVVIDVAGEVLTIPARGPVAAEAERPARQGARP